MRARKHIATHGSVPPPSHPARRQPLQRSAWPLSRILAWMAGAAAAVVAIATLADWLA